KEAAGDRLFLRNMMVNLDDEPVLVDFGALQTHKIVLERVVGGRRETLQNCLRNSTQRRRSGWNHIERAVGRISERIQYAVELPVRACHRMFRIWVINFTRIDWAAVSVINWGAIGILQLCSQQLTEISLAECVRDRRQRRVIRTGAIREPRPLNEEKGSVVSVIKFWYPYRAANGAAEFVLLERGLLKPQSVGHKSGGVQRIVLQVIK